MTAPFKKIFVTGIGTEIGKTISSAVLTAHFKADYWKPVQSGDLADSDSIKIKKSEVLCEATEKLNFS